MSSLQQQLDARKARFVADMPAEVVDLMQRANDALSATGAAARALKTGDLAPDVTLPGADGVPVNLGRLLAEGPVVLTFYRGGWCPYCNLELRAYQAVLGDLRGLGAKLVAVSPELPDHALATSAKNALAFDVLSDRGCTAAKAFGIAFTLEEPLRALYAKLGHALPDINGTDDWTLPIPATFVIDTDHRVLLSHVDPEYRNRLEPATVLELLARRAERRTAA